MTKWRLGALVFAAVLGAGGCNKKSAEPAPATTGSASGTVITPALDSAVELDAAVALDGVVELDAAMAADSGSGSGSGSGSASATAMVDDPTNYPHHDSTFDKLAPEARSKFMKEHVTPTMKRAFQKFDPNEYADFGCKTCHGKNAREVHFHMPNPNLPKLDFAKLKAGKQEPKVAKWIGEVVEPEMAKLLGAEVASESNPKGFSCLDCHVEKK